MKFKLIISQRAEELLDNILYYIINQLKNSQAAANLLNQIEHVYDNLQQNPMIYACLDDVKLKERVYRKASIQNYDYIIIYRVDVETYTVYVLGFFHTLESYINKL